MIRKNFNVPDHGLWDEIKNSIQPLSKRKIARSKGKLLGGSAIKLPTLRTAAEVFSEISKPVKTPLHPPAISAFDRRTAQRLGRGSLEPEARIDLHGENLETARYVLLNFMSQQRLRGARLVLVITGKGASQFARHTLHGHSHFHTPEREGKLRREVPVWFHEANFRTHIIGFQPAHPRHGGGGAFYVRLRRNVDEQA